MNLKKIICQELEEPMRGLGYQFVSEESGIGYYPFFKKDEIGFDVGLILDKSSWSKTIRPEILVPTHPKLNLFYITKGKQRQLDYHNEDDVRSHMRTILSEFTIVGHTWIKSNAVEKFDPTKIYTYYVDGFFEKYGFDRTYMSDNLLVGGIVVYSKEGTEIEFKHGSITLSFSCTIVEESNIKLLEYIAKDNNVEKPLLGIYKSKDDYDKKIMAYLKVFKEYYFK